MTLKASISWIDGCGKSSTIAWTTESLGQEYLIAKVGRPSYIFGPSNLKEEINNNISSKIEKYRPIVNKRWLRPIIAWLNAVFAINQWIITENILKDYQPDILINSRDTIIDSIVYSSFYIPPTRHIGTNIKINALQYLTQSQLPNMFIYMDIDPENSIERIIKSWRPLDRHETVENLTNLRNHYEEIMSYLYGHTSTSARPIDVNELTLPQVIKLMSNTIKEGVLESDAKNTNI